MHPIQENRVNENHTSWLTGHTCRYSIIGFLFLLSCMPFFVLGSQGSAPNPADLFAQPPASSWYNHCLRQLDHASCGRPSLFCRMYVHGRWYLLLRQQKFDIHYFLQPPPWPKAGSAPVTYFNIRSKCAIHLKENRSAVIRESTRQNNQDYSLAAFPNSVKQILCSQR